MAGSLIFDLESSHKFTDYIAIPAQRGVKVEVNLVGDGASDFDFEVLSGAKQTVLKQNGNTSNERGSFTPSMSREYMIAVSNFTGRRSRYKLQMRWERPVTGSMAVSRILRGGVADNYQFEYKAGQKATLELRGNYGTNLDITVIDPNGKKVAETTDISDQEYLIWDVKDSGRYTVNVINRGLKASFYSLRAN